MIQAAKMSIKDTVELDEIKRRMRRMSCAWEKAN